MSLDRRLGTLWVLATACGGGDADSGSDGGSSGASAVDSTGTDATTTTSSGSAGTTATTTSADSSSSEGGVIYDVGEGGETDSAGVDCECGSQLGFSYIWVANSAQGTVSKINTETLVEEGRYITRPDGVGDPSRTSVSLSGRAVAVANRSGGVVKIWSREEYCDGDVNGVPGVQTSTGAADVLPWGQDDCVAWYTAFDGYVSQRPIAWAAGEQDPRTCEYTGEQVWTAGADAIAHVHLLDGATGEVVASVDDTGMGTGIFGQYGGAVDRDGDFWVVRNGYAPGLPNEPDLVEVRRSDLTWTGHKFPETGVAGYGITVDAQNRVWLACNGFNTVARFDPPTATWTTGTAGFTTFAGIVEGPDDRVWTGGTTGTLVWFDRETLAVGETLELGEMIKGVSVDLDGNLWAVSMTTAYKIDPQGPALIDTYAGLDGPYTYSDMTGWALQNAACDPAG